MVAASQVRRIIAALHILFSYASAFTTSLSLSPLRHHGVNRRRRPTANIRRITSYSSMECTLLLATLIQPCNALKLENPLPFPDSSTGLFCLGIAVAFGLLACYIFYPAYKNTEGGLGCTVTTLAGDEKSNHTDNILSLVIPAYNEVERLPIMLDATLEYLNANRKHLTQLFGDVVGVKGASSELVRCELVIVDDGSTDDTEVVARKYASNIKSGDTVKLISMHKNSGKGGAVKTGMINSSGQLCLMIDADGATDISDGLPKLLKEMKGLVAKQQQSDNNSSYLSPSAVFGSRAHLEEESTATRSKIRTILMHGFHFFVKTLVSPSIKDTQCGFKLFTRSAVALCKLEVHLLCL